MKVILFLFFSILLFGCKTNEQVVQEPASTQVTSDGPIQLKASIGRLDQASDAISIQEVKITGNKMILTVSYGGGCSEHTFQLIGSTAISKSMPPIRSIQLVHNANGDKCKMNITKNIEIDITDLAYQQKKESKIMLSLEGWKTQLEYTYE